MHSHCADSTLIATLNFANHLNTAWHRYPRPQNKLMDEVLTGLLLQVNGTHYDSVALERLYVKLEEVHRLTQYSHQELVDMKVFMFLWNWLYQNTDEPDTTVTLYQHCFLPLMVKVLAAKPKASKPSLPKTLFLVDL